MLFTRISSAFPDFFADFALSASVQQISPNLWEWST
jgi:hypothetical protein